MSKYSDNMPPSLKGAIEWFYDEIPAKSVVLDFGCSTGYFGSYIKQQKDCEVYGIEISEDKKEAAKVLDGVYSFDLDGEWPKEVYERKYDLLFIGDVIEHLKRPDETLRKAKKLLKKNGKIYVSTPNIAHVSTRLELLGGNFEYEDMGILDSTHLKYFTLRSLKQLAEDSGYNITRVDSSTNDYPRGVIKSILARYGLEPKEKFWKMIAKDDARAFQYKLVLEPVLGEEKRQSVPKPVQKPEQFRDDFIEDLSSQVKSIKQHADQQSEIIDYWKTRAETLQEANEQQAYKIKSLESSLVRKLKTGVKKVTKKR